MVVVLGGLDGAMDSPFMEQCNECACVGGERAGGGGAGGAAGGLATGPTPPSQRRPQGLTPRLSLLPLLLLTRSGFRRSTTSARSSCARRACPICWTPTPRWGWRRCARAAGTHAGAGGPAPQGRCGACLPADAPARAPSPPAAATSVHPPIRPPTHPPTHQFDTVMHLVEDYDPPTHPPTPNQPPTHSV